MTVAVGKHARLALVLMLTAIASVSLMWGPSAGTAFAFLAPPPLEMPGVSSLPPLTTAAAVDTGVAVAGTDAAVAGATTAVGVCAAATAGTCAVAAVAVVAAAYGAYKVIHWAWGGSHVTAPPPAPPSGLSTTLPIHFGNLQVVGYSYNGDVHITYTVQGAGPDCLNTSDTLMIASRWVSSGNPDKWDVTSFGQSNSQYNTINGSITHFGSLAGAGYAPPSGGDVVIGCWASANPSVQTAGPTYRPAEYFPSYVAPPLPQHTVKVTINCRHSDGSSSSVTVTSSGFDDSSSTVPDLNFSNGCPTGTVPRDASVVETTPGQADTPLYNMPAPTVDPGNPCAPVGAACAPTLQQSVNGQWVTQTATQPSITLDGTWRCRWMNAAGTLDGGALPMTDCVATYGTADPKTPTPVDNQPRNGPAVDNNGADCLLKGWGWNPVDWVYIPVKCVLQWAFVPGADGINSDVGQIQDAWNGSAPGAYGAAAVDIFTAFTPKSSDNPDCNGIHVAFDVTPHGGVPGPWAVPDRHVDLGYPFQSCTGLSKTMHDFLYPILQAFILVGAFFGASRPIMRAIGYEPPMTMMDDHGSDD